MQAPVIGIPWFTRETYSILRATFEDGHKLHETYDEWRRDAEGVCRSLEARGARIVRVQLDADEFSDWCGAQGLKLNAEARSRYAAFIAEQRSVGRQ